MPMTSDLSKLHVKWMAEHLILAKRINILQGIPAMVYFDLLNWKFVLDTENSLVVGLSY